MISPVSFESSPSCCSTTPSPYGVGSALSKILVLGPKGCGKSSLVRRLLGQAFDPYVRPTLGSNLHSMTLLQKDIAECIELWDTSGNPTFQSVAPHYYHNVDLLVGVFDASRPRASLAELTCWIDDFVQHHPKHIPIFIVANKIDLVSSKVSPFAFFDLPYSRCEHFITSALTERGVQDLADSLQQTVEQLYLKRIEEHDLLRSWVLLEADPEDQDEYHFTQTVRIDSLDKPFDYSDFLNSPLLRSISSFFLRICQFV